MKKFLSFLLTAVMVIAMSMPAFANTNYTITINEPENSSVSMEGNMYSAYKLFDATYNEDIGSYAYTLADTFEAFAYTPEGEGEAISGNALVDYVRSLSATEEAGADVNKLNAFSKAVNNFIKEKTISASASVTAGSGAKTATITVSDAGYYVVTGTATAQGDNQTVTALCALTSATPDASITLKADAPKIEKDILVDADGNETEVDTNTASIGDKVNYQLTSNVPKMDGYNKYFFVLKDTLSAGLTFNEDTVDVANTVITIGGATLTKDEDYVITYDAEDNAVEIVFRNFIQYADQVGDEIVIKYSATINEDAVIGNTGNTNTVDLTYSNDPTFDYEGAGTPDDPEDPDNDKPGTDEPVGETPDEVVITYVTGIDLIKVDDKENRLTGAEFQIKGEKLNQVIVIKDEFTVDDVNGTYYELNDGTYTETEPAPATQDDYVDGITKYTKTSTEEIIETTETVQATGIVGDDGVLRFDGLAEGEYIITELKAPDGFNILKNSIKVTISCELPDPIAEGTEEAKWSYTTCEVDENGDTVGKVEDSKPATDGRVELEIVNLTGAELPETGGIGTTIFTVAGIILMLGAVVLLVTKRKMSAKEL